MKRTKIVATIGPASSDYKMLSRMVDAGMDVCRLNFSHNTHESHLEVIKTIKKLRKNINREITIFQDLQGPKIRVSNDISKNGIKINLDEIIVLINEKKVSPKTINKKCKTIPVSFDIGNCVSTKNKIFIHDGIIELKIIKVVKDLVYCKVLTPGIIFPKKGVNIPYANITESCLTKKDKADLKFGLDNNVDWVGLSFVKTAQDMIDLKKFIKKYKPNSDVKILAKIETPEALINIDGIIKESDGIMIARGDLGVEIEIETVPIVQKDIVTKCVILGKPVIVATQMLESMIRNSRPTRAEVSDVANAVIDHADAVMLSEESAFGKHPLESVEMMSKIINATEGSPYDDTLKIDSTDKIKDVFAISESVKELALSTKAKLIIVATNSGHSACMIASLRPEAMIVVLSKDEKVRKQLGMSWGVYSYEMIKSKSIEEFINKSIGFVKTKKLVKKGDVVIVVSSKESDNKENMNLVGIEKI